MIGALSRLEEFAFALVMVYLKDRGQGTHRLALRSSGKVITALARPHTDQRCIHPDIVMYISTAAQRISICAQFHMWLT